jgi:hypothetical protein
MKWSKSQLTLTCYEQFDPGGLVKHTSSTKIKCSIGITAYNEEANIGQLLQAMLDQRLYSVEISEIIVVASGCRSARSS